MPILIPHRFIERLLPDRSVSFIDTMVIGTFNPGLPVMDLLAQEEKHLFDKITATKRFQGINQVKNFYDRPRNRLWKIFDLLAYPEFYSGKSFKARNPLGLKYYRNMDRELVFKNQTSFCLNNGIFITDIVRKIEPSSFENIYDNFPDKGIEGAKCYWNTKGIMMTIEKYKPRRVLINFSVGRSIPKISAEISAIQGNFPEITHCMPSTSGAAGNSYEFLYGEWCKHLSKNGKFGHLQLTSGSVIKNI